MTKLAVPWIIWLGFVLLAGSVEAFVQRFDTNEKRSTTYGLRNGSLVVERDPTHFGSLAAWVWNTSGESPKVTQDSQIVWRLSEPWVAVLEFHQTRFRGLPLKPWTGGFDGKEAYLSLWFVGLLVACTVSVRRSGSSRPNLARASNSNDAL